MRLTIEEHPHAIKRYAHLKRARGIRAEPCSVALPGSPRACTRASGHRGPHVAHGRFSGVVAVWDTPNGAGQSMARQRVGEGRARSARGDKHRLAARTPVGLKGRPGSSFVGRFVDGLVRFLKSPDEVAFVFLFMLFVYWGVQWMIMIFR